MLDYLGVILEIDGDEWDLRTRYGCYSGARFGSDLGSNLGEVLEELQHVRSFAESGLGELDVIEGKVRGLFGENAN